MGGGVQGGPRLEAGWPAALPIGGWTPGPQRLLPQWQSTISAIETGRVNLGVERAKSLARALRCHPAVLVFPGWQIDVQHGFNLQLGTQGLRPLQDRQA